MVTLPSLKYGCEWFQFEVLNDLRHQFDEHSRRQDALRQELNVSHLEDVLRVGTVEADEAAEAIAESFLDSEYIGHCQQTSSWLSHVVIFLSWFSSLCEQLGWLPRPAVMSKLIGHISVGGPNTDKVGGPNTYKVGCPNTDKVGGPNTYKVGGPNTYKVGGPNT